MGEKQLSEKSLIRFNISTQAKDPTLPTNPPKEQPPAQPRVMIIKYLKTQLNNICFQNEKKYLTSVQVIVTIGSQLPW